jgi:hypothetical protein
MQSAGGLGGGAMGECLIAGSDPAFSPGEEGVVSAAAVLRHILPASD